MIASLLLSTGQTYTFDVRRARICLNYRVKVEKQRKKRLMKVAAGRSGQYSLACDSSDSKYAWAWGDDSCGQLGIEKPSPHYSSMPVQVKRGQQTGTHEHLKDIVAISAGNFHVLALDKDGYIYAWGKNEEDQLGLGHTDPDHHEYATQMP